MNPLLEKMKSKMSDFHVSEDGNLNLKVQQAKQSNYIKVKTAQANTNAENLQVIENADTIPASTDKELVENPVAVEKADIQKKSLGKKVTQQEVFKVDEARGELIEKHIDAVNKALKEMLNPRALMEMEEDKAKQELTESIQLIFDHFQYNLSPNEKETIKKHIVNDMLGHGPLEELIHDDDISDIMVNGFDSVFIERNGRVEKTDIRFRSAEHLNNTCRRIVQKVGRRVDNSSPMCDARLLDGSRVNVIMPPLSVRGASLTIRKFKKDKLTLEKLVEYGTLDERGAELLQIIAACRVNVIVSGGTGSGKTTMLNCLTKYMSDDERIITCEDSAELQLQQPHVVTLETRNSNNENSGEVTMRDLVKNCLRMRPERIVIGEVRGAEAFDLLQAMNTGHDGSMGTLHANTPRDAISRLESMISMANLNLPNSSIKEQIASSLNVIVHVQRLNDGSRKLTHISELSGMDNGVYLMNDLYNFVSTGKDADGKVTGKFDLKHTKPQFHDKIVEFGLEERFSKLVGYQA